MNGGPLQAALVEAFTEAPLGGNGAGVVLLREPATPLWMQAVAARLQQSETAFLWRGPDGAWRLRWFTPSCEVPLCGHATLAAVLALGHWGQLAVGQELVLHSRSGPLAVRLEGSDPASARIVLPSSGLEPQPIPPYLAQLLGDAPLAYWSSPLGYRVALMADRFDLPGLVLPSAQLGREDRQGLVVMQALGLPQACGLSQLEAGEPSRPAFWPQVLGQPAHYQLRFFAPGLGIAEDPVTGSAHCTLVPSWAARLGRQKLSARQLSARGGALDCELTGDRVRLAGHTRLYLRGHISL